MALCTKNCPYSVFSAPYVSTFGLNTNIYRVNLPVQSECGKIRTRKTPSMDTFHAAILRLNFELQDNQFVGNKAKGRISKRVFQENKARQIFRKTNIFYPLIRTRTCANDQLLLITIICYSFLEITSLISWKTMFV